MIILHTKHKFLAPLVG